MVLSDQHDGAGLQALLAFAGTGDEANLIADAEAIKRTLDYAVAVHVDLFSISREDETVALIEEKAHDRAVFHRFMRLGLPASESCVIFELASHRIEGIAYRDVYLFMGVMFGRVSPHGDLVPGNFHVDTEVIDAPFMLMAMSALDDDAAAHDLRVEAIELVDALADMRFDRFGRLHAAKCDLWGQLHIVLRVVASPGRRDKHGLRIINP